MTFCGQGERKIREVAQILAALAIAAVFFSQNILAGELEATLRIEPSSVSAGQSAIASVEIRSAANVSQIAFPPVEGLRIRSGGTQYSTRIINGVVEQSSIANFSVKALKEGDYTLGPASVTASNGKVYQTNSVQFKVKAVTQQAGEKTSDFYLETVFEPETPVYVNQPIDIAWRLISQHELRAYNIDAAWLMGQEAFRILDADELMTRWRNGKREGLKAIRVSDRDIIAHTYNRQNKDDEVEGVFEVRRTFVPLTAGTFDFAATTVEAEVMMGSASLLLDDPFMDGFFGGGRKVRRAFANSSAHQVIVKPLPEEGRPESFTGTVGTFKMLADVQPQKVGVGETVTLAVTLDGTGALDLVGRPMLKACDGCRALDPEESTDAVTAVQGKKIFRFPLYMEKAGSVQIPAVTYGFFDPAAGKYRELVAGPFTVEVSADRGEKGISANFVPGEQRSRKGVVDLGRDITDIVGGVENLRNDGPRLAGWLFYAIMIAPPMLGILGGLALRARRIARADVASMRRASAYANFVRGLDEGTDTASLLRRYLADVSGGSFGGEIGPDEAALVCADNQAGDLSRETALLLEKLDTARFSPGATGTETLKKETAALVGRIEQCRR